MRAVVVAVALLATDAHAIVGGAPSDDPSVIALVRDDELVCSGIVIAPHMLLTAAHCVAGDDPPDAIVDGEPVPPTLVFLAPGFDPGTLANDLALVLFHQPFLATPRPLAMSSPAVGASMTLVGFGRTAPDDTTPYAQRTGSATIIQTSPSGIVSSGPAFTCEGDSGGPALVAGAVVGVTSAGDCAGESRHVRVEDHRAFIETIVERTRPRSASSGDRCWYATNCSEGDCLPAIDDPRISFCTPYCIESACPPGLTCVDARCVHPLPSPGATGSACITDDECVDELCVARDGADSTETVCSRRCFTDLPGFNCPPDTACERAADGEEACFVEPVDSGCCSSSRGASGGIALALLVCLGLGQLLRGRVTP